VASLYGDRPPSDVERHHEGGSGTGKPPFHFVHCVGLPGFDKAVRRGVVNDDSTAVKAIRTQRMRKTLQRLLDDAKLMFWDGVAVSNGESVASLALEEVWEFFLLNWSGDGGQNRSKEKAHAKSKVSGPPDVGRSGHRELMSSLRKLGAMARVTRLFWLSIGNDAVQSGEGEDQGDGNKASPK